MEPKKYIKMLISMPGSTYKNFVQIIPNGQRSEYLVNLLNQNLAMPEKKEVPVSRWSKMGKNIKENYTQKQIKQMTKDAWKDVD